METLISIKGEKLKIVIGFENYLASESGLLIKMPYVDSDGKTRSGKILSEKVDKAGYVSYSLIKDHKTSMKLAHRIVAENFIGFSELQVNHKDGNKRNNHHSNLEYVTDKQNKEHAVSNNIFQKGSTNGKSKLTEEQVVEIKILLQTNRTQKEISEMFNVSAYTISDINNNKTWKHVTAKKKIGL